MGMEVFVGGGGVGVSVSGGVCGRDSGGARLWVCGCMCVCIHPISVIDMVNGG